MTVVQSTKDTQNLTLTLVADFSASSEQLWDLWEDPRKLERWWGPPTFPATFTRHDFQVGGESRYFMSGPAGERPRGWWRIDTLESPSRIEFANGLADEDGEPRPGVAPMTCTATFEQAGGMTRMTVVSRFVDVEQMATMLDMGMQEGFAQAIGQIDALLESAAV